PEAPSVDSPEKALNADLDDLRHWYLAPENPSRIAAAGLQFALTTDGLSKTSEFLPNLRTAVARGLAQDVALAALTVNPARMLGIDARQGTLERGKLANIVVVDGDLFATGSTIRDVWVSGERYVIDPGAAVDPRGTWPITSTPEPPLNGQLAVGGRLSRPRGNVRLMGEKSELSDAEAGTDAGRIQVAFPGTAVGLNGVVQLSASITGDQATGWSTLPDGARPTWSAERSNPFAAPAARDARSRASLVLSDIRPATAFGRERLPEQPQHVLVRNATIWTQGPQGRLENADMLVTRGKVVRVGEGLEAPRGAVIVDAAGKHVTQDR